VGQEEAQKKITSWEKKKTTGQRGGGKKGGIKIMRIVSLNVFTGKNNAISLGKVS